MALVYLHYTKKRIKTKWLEPLFFMQKWTRVLGIDLKLTTQVLWSFFSPLLFVPLRTLLALPHHATTTKRGNKRAYINKKVTSTWICKPLLTFLFSVLIRAIYQLLLRFSFRLRFVALSLIFDICSPLVSSWLFRLC